MQYLASRLIVAVIPRPHTPSPPVAATALDAESSPPLPQFWPWMRTISRGDSSSETSTPTSAAEASSVASGLLPAETLSSNRVFMALKANMHAMYGSFSERLVEKPA